VLAVGITLFVCQDCAEAVGGIQDFRNQSIRYSRNEICCFVLYRYWLNIAFTVCFEKASATYLYDGKRAGFRRIVDGD
jgi:hypothetical protein